MMVIETFTEYLITQKNYSVETVKNYAHDIHQFETFIKNEGFGQSVMDATRIRLAKNYVQYLSTQNFSKKSIARKISALKTFFSFLVENKLMQENIFDQIKAPKVPKTLPHLIDDDAIGMLFQSIDQSTSLGYRNYLILDLLYSCGLRASELVGLSIGDIFLSNQQILIHGKGSKDRYVPLHQTLIDTLRKYITFVRPKLLAKGHNVQTKQLLINYKGESLTVRGVRIILKKIIENSGETYKMHPHLLRHAFATTLLNHGADLRVVQELLGHAHLKSTQVYTQVSSEVLKEKYKKTSPRMIKK